MYDTSQTGAAPDIGNILLNNVDLAVSIQTCTQAAAPGTCQSVSLGSPQV